MEIVIKSFTPIPLLGVKQKDASVWPLSQTLKQGNTYVIASPSGRGKSSIVHMMYGIRSDYEGQIFFDGTDTKSLKKQAWAKVRRETLSIVFQDLKLFSHLTALENILLKSELTKHKTHDEIKNMAAAIGVESFLEKECGKLSFGQQQRIAILRALTQPYSFLLLDEPFSHLDKDNEERVSALLAKDAESKNAGIVITSLGSEYFRSKATAINL